MTLLAVLLVAAAGHGLLRVVTGAWPVTLAGPLGSAGLSVLFGAAATGLTTTCAAVVGASTRPWVVVGPVLIILALAGVVRGEIARRLLIDRSAPGPATGPATGPPRWADGIVAVAVTAIGIGLLWGIGRAPARTNDEYAIWAVRGRTLSLAGHLDLHVFDGTLANYQHLDYPLLVPSLIAWGDGLRGRADDYTAHVLLISVTLAMLAVVGWALNRLAGPVAGVAGVLLAAGTPDFLARWATLLTADATLVAFTVSMIVVLALWLADRQAWQLAVAVGLGCGAAMTKVEGSLFALAAFAAALICAREGRRRVLVGFGIIVASELPWLAWTRLHHLNSDLINSRTLTLHHLRQVLPFAGLSVREIVHNWPGLGWVMVGVCVAAMAGAAAVPGHRRLVAYVGVTWAVSTLGMWAQYWISAGHTQTVAPTAAAIKAHFESSASRVLLVPSILLTLALPLFAGRLFGQGRNAAASEANAADSASRQSRSGVSPAARQAVSESTE